MHKEWSGKKLMCAAKQVDDNEIKITNMRNIKVEQQIDNGYEIIQVS